MPPSLNAGKVNMGRLKDTLGLSDSTINGLRTNALIRIIQFKELNPDKDYIQIFRLIPKSRNDYSPTNLTECIDCLVFDDIYQQADFELRSLEDCITK